MSPRFNIGNFESDRYVKKVSFSKSVLWKSREISLNKTITSQFRVRGTKEIVFVDEVKKERWTASVEKLRQCAVLKKEGQEEQFYFPITAFKVEKV